MKLKHEPSLDGVRAIAQDYAAKPATYFGNPRRDYVAALPANPCAAILELGCGDGATGALALAEGKCGRYVGLELHGPSAERARAVLSEVIAGNVETLELPYPPASFDALICSEVLEHLVDPAAALAKLIPLLKPGARVYASSPNIAHWRVILGLLFGRFDYAETGLMDRTHLRWFTPRSFRRLFVEAGAEVDAVRQMGRAFWCPQFAWRQIDLRGHTPGHLSPLATSPG